MFVWVYICVVVGLFLVSVFSSLLFLCFFLIREGLLFLSQHSTLPLRPGWAYPRYCYLDGLLNMNGKENVTVNDRGSERGRSPPAQHVSLASTTCSHMTILFSPGCGWCASGCGRCRCKWPGREHGWCKGRRCEGCQHRLRGAWGANAGVEGTNGATHSASVGIDGLGAWWMV